MPERDTDGIRPQHESAKLLARRRAFRDRCRAAGIELAVIFPGPQLTYLIGAEVDAGERLLCLLVEPAAHEDLLLVPSTEFGALRGMIGAAAELKAFIWTDGEDPLRLLDELCEPCTRVAVSADAPAGVVLRMQRMPLLLDAMVGHLRAIKSADELNELRQAAAAIDRVHERMPEWLIVGRTEREVAADLGAAITAEGHASVAFVIVASGPNSADPHHEPSQRVLEPGDVVIVDIGGRTLAGYYSDCTRTYSLGPARHEVASRVAHLQRAQLLAISAAQIGIPAEQVDAAARAHLASCGLDDAFTHRLGHSIGMDLHEAPFLVAGDSTLLAAHMTFTIEPGIYFQGRWGARIEDVVELTPSGPVSLNRAPKGLVEVPIRAH